MAPPLLIGTLIISCMMTPTIIVKLGSFTALCFLASAVVFAFICEQILYPLLPSTPPLRSQASKEKEMAGIQGPGEGRQSPSSSSRGLKNPSPMSPEESKRHGHDSWSAFIAKKLTTTPEHVKKLEALEKQGQANADVAAGRTQMFAYGDYHRHGLLRHKGRRGSEVDVTEWAEVIPEAGESPPRSTLPKAVPAETRAERKKLGAKPTLPVPRPKQSGFKLVVDDFEVPEPPRVGLLCVDDCEHVERFRSQRQLLA